MVANTSMTSPWNCPTCNISMTTPFCSGCGERPLNPRDLTMRGLALQLAAAFSNVDGKLLRSLGDLIARPGALTDAYQLGRRKPFIAPFPLFLMANVLFFAVQSFCTFRIFSTSIDGHLYDQDWSALARELIEARLVTLGTTLDLYRPIFDQAVAVNAKSLIGLMVPPLTLSLSLIFASSRRPMAVHAVFALHFYAFLLVLCSLPLVAMAIKPSLFGSNGILFSSVDLTSSIILVVCCGTYLYTAVGRVYAARGTMQILQSLLLTVAATAFYLGYRFALFIITLYTTSV